MMRVKEPTEKSKTLPDESVVALAREVLEHFGFKPMDEEWMLSRFKRPIPTPIMLNNSIVQLWIDKYYIAFSYLDEEDIHYVYIAEKHIEEEECSYANPKNGKRLHQSIRNDFKLAKSQMWKSEKKYALFLKRIVNDSKR